MDKKLRWGILGTGNIARQFAAGVKASGRCQLAAVGSRTAKKASEFAAEFQIPAAHGEYAGLIQQKNIDAIYVSLPNSMHHEWTIAALKAGKHVLCEKPLAMNAAEAEEMFDVAQSTGKTLIEAFMYRSHPQTRSVVEAVKSGTIGELKIIRTSFCFSARVRQGNIRFSSELAGGALMDVGCYCINLSRLLAGAEPKSIQCVGQLHESGVDEYAAGTLVFPNGIMASMMCGLTVHADNTAWLCGTEGYIEIPIPWKPPAGQATYVVSRSAPPRMDTPGGKPVAPGSAPREVRQVEAPGELYGFEADDFASVILDGATPRLTRSDSVGNMRVLDEMRWQIGVRCKGA